MTESPLLTHGMPVVFSVPGAFVWPATLDRRTDPKALYAKFAKEDKPWHIDCCWGYYCKQNNLTPKDHDMLHSILSVDRGITLKTLVETRPTLEAALKALTRPNPFDNTIYLPNDIQVLVDGTRKGTLLVLRERKSLVLQTNEIPGLPLWITPSTVNPEEDYENSWFTRLTVNRPGNPTLREVLCLWSKEEIRALNSNAVQGTNVTVAKPETYDAILTELRDKETKLTQEIATLTTIRDLQASNKALLAQREQLVTECHL
jgi:hypothetical protein